MLKKRFCAVLALILLCAVLPLSTAFAHDAPALSVEETAYDEGDIAAFFWTEVEGAESYELFVSRAPYGERNLVVEDAVDEAEYNIGGLLPGNYRANVRAVLPGGKTALSDHVYFSIGGRGGELAYAQGDADPQVTFLWPVKDDPAYSGTSFAITAMDIYFDGGSHGKLQNALDINHEGMTKRYETREIVATADGIVEEVHLCGHSGISCSTRSCIGTYIRIAHDLPDPVTGEMTRYISAYYHLDPKTVAVEKGGFVEQGETIARMGSTGNSSGIHLHFAIRDSRDADIPTLEFFMNGYYMPLIQFKYFRKSSSGKFVAQNGKASRYSEWIAEHYRYNSSKLWVYAGEA